MPQSPPRNAEFKWLELTDFSPGIFSNNNLSGGLEVTATNVAMAQETDTFRCRALPTGGLGPLPRRKEDFALTTPPGSGNPTYRVCGLNTWGGVFVDPLVDTDQSHRAEVHLALDYYEAGSDTRYMKWLRERVYDDTPSTETIISRTFATAGSAGTARYAYFIKTRMRTSLPLSPGPPVMVCLWALNPIGASDDNRISRVHPDPDDTATNNTVVVGDEGEAYTLAVGHQGRIFLGKFLAYNRGVTTGLFSNENFVWTNVNLNTLSTSDPAVFVPEIDQNASDAASMSANQLLVIKQIGGGYVLQGDLDDVTVVRLPNLACPDGSDTVRGANTSIGYIYSAGDGGLYLWNGGDSAEPISQQLSGSTFASGTSLDGNNGQCDRWQDLFLAPCNWVMDLDQRGWWRIDDPDDFQVVFWSTSKYHSQTYGAPASFLGAETAFAMWEIDDLAYSFSWRSHPMWASQDRLIDTRECIVAIGGIGAVTITLIDEDDNTFAKTFISTSETIRNYRANMSMVAQNIQVKIESSGIGYGEGDTDLSAPIVHRVYFGYVETQHLALDTSGS